MVFKHNVPTYVGFFINYIDHGYFVVIHKVNQSVDDEINKVCEKYYEQFKSKGYSVQYRTECTVYCKPKHVYPTRSIIFHPVYDISTRNNNESNAKFD